MANMSRESRIASLEEKQRQIEMQLMKEKKEQEEELKAICWRGLQAHVISRKEALQFKKAMEREEIIELLFEKEMLPKRIQEAIKESEDNRNAQM